LNLFIVRRKPTFQAGGSKDFITAKNVTVCAFINRIRIYIVSARRTFDAGDTIKLIDKVN
jgi:hypothetical protein